MRRPSEGWQPVAVDWRAEVDDELRPLLPDGGPVLGDLTLADLPALYAERREVAPVAPAEGVACADIVVASVSVRRYSPTGVDAAKPLLVAIHGGGFIVGSNLMDADVLSAWARDLGCVVLSIDYRLAPECPYPAAIDDCESVLLGVVAQPLEFGIVPDRIVIYGVSAGGALAAALCLRLRDRGLRIAGLMLEAPTLDDRDHHPSRSWQVPMAGPSTIALGWHAYIGERSGDRETPADAAPARATDLAQLPPTFIGVGTVDALHDEAVDFGGRLVNAGNDVTVREYLGATHGFASIAPTSALARQLRAEQTAWLAERFAR